MSEDPRQTATEGRRSTRARRAAAFVDQVRAGRAREGEGLEGSGEGLSLRAFVLGGLLCLFIATATIYSNAMIRGTFMAWAFSTPVALFLFFYLVLANVLLAILRPRLRLRQEELTLIYVMMIVSASLPTFGLVAHLLPMITGVFYYATPENRWGELILPHVPEWIAPRGESVIRGFYEGVLPGEDVPWGAWAAPLVYWSVLLMALYLVSACLMVMVRKQWVERERLAYPIVQAPLELVRGRSGDSGQRSGLPPLLRQSQTWIGFALPVVVGTLNGLSTYFPFVPALRLTTSVVIFAKTTTIPFYFSFSLVGFSWFINRDLAAGIWVFYLLAQVEQRILSLAGLQGAGNLGWYSNPSSPYLTHQAVGAMLMLALLALWRGRDHLGDIFRKGLRGDPAISDGDEILSYRAAVLGLVGGLLVMGVWLEAAGIPAVTVPLFLAVALLLFLALSRIVAEAGVALVRAPLIAPDFVVASVGVSRLGPAGLTGLAYTYPWTADIVTFPMASIANGLKMAHEVIQGRKRGLFWGVILAIAVTLAGAYWMMLYVSYRHGGINLDAWFWLGSSHSPLDYVARLLQQRPLVELTGWLFTGIGAGLMWLFMYLQQRVMWWSIHPLGLAMTGTQFTSSVMWFNVFVAWALKGLVLKYGGSALYSRARGFFLGMILGAFAISGTWLVIDYLTGKQSNFVLVW